MGGLKRARDKNPSVTQFAVEPAAPVATEDAAPAATEDAATAKKLKLSFKIKKPTT